ncbi:MAG: hypothetical protein RR444_07525 [Oscillospiraceae bacterium]
MTTAIVAASYAYGEAVMKLNGSDNLVRLGNLSLHYVNYAGIGIKIALGMGGVQINKS